MKIGKIKIVSGVNWKLQLDNQLPETLKIGNTYKIEWFIIG